MSSMQKLANGCSPRLHDHLRFGDVLQGRKRWEFKARRLSSVAVPRIFKFVRSVSGVRALKLGEQVTGPFSIFRLHLVVRLT